MKILINLSTASELITYEALSLAMTMATFDHEVQLLANAEVVSTAMQTANRMHGMLKSLDLYDLPAMWLQDTAQNESLLHNLYAMLPSDIAEQVVIKQATDISLADFDSVLTF